MTDLFDTHFHLGGAIPPETLWQDSRKAGVRYMMVSACTEEESRTAAQFASEHDDVWFNAGIQPEEAEKWSGDLSFLRELSDSKKFAAVGEIGLDRLYSEQNEKKQIAVLESMLETALELGKPAVIHCRDKEGESRAYDILHSLLRDFADRGGRMDLHCYTGPMDYMKKYADLDAYFGVDGILTFPKGENVRALARAFPRKRILAETDSPYLAPVPFRGKENIPGYLPKTVEVLAKELGISGDECAKLTTENAFRFFFPERSCPDGGRVD